MLLVLEKKVNASLIAASEDQVKFAYRANLKAEPGPGMNGTIEPDQMKTMVKEPEKPVPVSMSRVVHTNNKFLVADSLFSSSNVFLKLPETFLNNSRRYTLFNPDIDFSTWVDYL